MTTEQYLKRAARAHDNNDKQAEDYYLWMAQQANTPPEAEDLVQGAERIKTVFEIVAMLLLLVAIMLLVGGLNL